MKKTITIVTPAYNEEDCVVELADRLQKVFLAEPNYDFEVIVVENGSQDRTYELLTAIREDDKRFKVLQLSRNFGGDGGLTAGLHHAKGDACIIMNADLEDPPEVIPDFIRQWESGYQVVYGVVKSRPKVSPVRKLTSSIFYFLASRLSGGSIVAGVSDFRLIDKKVVDAFSRMPENTRFVRALLGWVGFDSIGVPFSRGVRFGGSSKASTSWVINLATKGIFSHSTLPLRLITFLGLISAVVSISGLAVLAYIYFAHGVPFSGFGTLASFGILGFSVLALSIGVLGEYIGLIYEETKRRPLYIVKNSDGL